jgi:hypothetical protein
MFDYFVTDKKKTVTADDYFCVNFTTKEKKIPGTFQTVEHNVRSRSIKYHTKLTFSSQKGILISRHNDAPGSSTTRITVYGTQGKDIHQILLQLLMLNAVCIELLLFRSEASATIHNFQITVTFHNGRTYMQFSEPSAPLRM